MLNFELSPEQKALVDETRRFTREKIIPIAGEADRTHEFPLDVFKEAWELGFVGPNIPEEYGGAGMGEVDHVLLTEELAFGCTGIQTSMTANVLAATPILIAGNDAQKKKYLGLLTSEPVFAAYALTEPAAGSDAAGIQATCRKDGNDWIINGSKCFITNAAWASWYIVFATVDPSLRHSGIMAFVIDRDSQGVSVGKTEDKLGQRASNTATVNFDDVRVPADNVLAEEGHGFKLAMQTFDRTRPDIGAGACGLIRRGLEESIAYALERKTFGVPIAEHQMVQAMIAEMGIKYEATRLLVHKSAWQIDQGGRNSLVASYSKAFGADSAMQVAIDAVQVFGGNGYMTEYPVEKLMRDAKILQIYEGTSQIQRMVIAKNLFAGVR
ncbi:MAG: acyl-CoA dehydrogenase family protein [Deltaproteobacteria bacterium]|jgi:acyl-CoA dehydrogenase|nr:acyl-CoA dehydrogenase family protein [Deltaproteobacteria bacterium]MBW2717153.1 acyl-CoA dehydrogenase family protein [Deltaproteobacteria bacterium]